MTPYDSQLRECLNAILAGRDDGARTTGQWALLQQSLREQCERSMERAIVQGIARGQARDALFALCAFADEVGLRKPSAMHFWAHSQLTQHFFNTPHDGASFYTRLAGLLRAPRAEVLRAYYMALALGYEGQHKGPVGETARAALMAEIRPHLGPAPQVLGGGGMERAHKAPPRRLSGLWMPALGLSLGLGLYLLLSMFVQRDATNHVKAIEALLQQ